VVARLAWEARAPQVKASPRSRGNFQSNPILVDNWGLSQGDHPWGGAREERGETKKAEWRVASAEWREIGRGVEM
jgi:hypothetical protein